MNDEISAIHLHRVVKDFKGDFWKKTVRVLHDITFDVNPGDIFGLIGPNGAGKTTTIKILLGLIKPTSGDATIFGNAVTDISFKKQIGYLPENAYYYDYLKAGEIVDFYGRIFGLSRPEREKRTVELLNLVGLGGKEDVKLRSFSKGMLQRVGIAQALVNDPKLVIFDEPMSGLDPIGRKEVRDIILRLADQGKTIMFSSHILSDIEAICERVAIVIKGKVKASGRLADLVDARIRSTEISLYGQEELAIPAEWEKSVSQRRTGNHVTLSVTDESLISPIIQKARDANLALHAVVPHKDSLEDLFLEKVEEKE